MHRDDLKPCSKCGSTAITSLQSGSVLRFTHFGCHYGPEVFVSKFKNRKDAIKEAKDLWNL